MSDNVCRVSADAKELMNGFVVKALDGNCDSHLLDLRGGCVSPRDKSDVGCVSQLGSSSPEFFQLVQSIQGRAMSILDVRASGRPADQATIASFEDAIQSVAGNNGQIGFIPVAPTTIPTVASLLAGATQEAEELGSIAGDTRVSPHIVPSYTDVIAQGQPPVPIAIIPGRTPPPKAGSARDLNGNLTVPYMDAALPQLQKTCSAVSAHNLVNNRAVMDRVLH
eukprot:6186300-Amphidinium_carterae.2